MKNLTKFAVTVGGVLASSVAFAQASTGTGGTDLTALSAALAIGISAFAAASAQGRTASAMLEGAARNPAAKDAMFQPLILSLVFMEFQALLGFVIAFLWTMVK